MQKKQKISFPNLKTLKEHEEINEIHLKKLIKKIISDGVLKRPIVVDKKTKIILDGAHRFNAFKIIGCKKIPVIFVNYDLPEIKVYFWKNSKKRLSKKMIVKLALSGKKLPPKTTKHMIFSKNKLKHISIIQKKVNIPLKALK